MKKRLGKFIPVVLVLCLLISYGLVQAESGGITIKLNRDFGYGGMGNDIQGTFSIVVSDPGPFEKVTFMMDDVVLGEVVEAPYRWQFSTDEYAPGEHQYWAVASLSDGTRLESNRITGFVLTKEESSQGMVKILGILFGSIAVVGIISWVVSSTISKKTKTQTFEGNGMPAGFATMGGAVCPKCGKPFSFHFFKVNLLTHKIDRCPHCGKWVMVKSMTYQMMEAAVRQTTVEKVQSTGSESGLLEDSDNELKKQLDQSRFMDS